MLHFVTEKCSPVITARVTDMISLNLFEPQQIHVIGNRMGSGLDVQVPIAFYSWTFVDPHVDANANEATQLSRKDILPLLSCSGRFERFINIGAFSHRFQGHSGYNHFENCEWVEAESVSWRQHVWLSRSSGWN